MPKSPKSAKKLKALKPKAVARAASVKGGAAKHFSGVVSRFAAGQRAH